MRKITITLILAFVGLLVFSQTNADILREWCNAENDGSVNVECYIYCYDLGEFNIFYTIKAVKKSYR